MGCGTSKAVQPIEDTANVENKLTNGTINGTVATGARLQSRPMTPVPKSVAFEISLDISETNGAKGSVTPPVDSGVKKQLPKRLLTLAEQPTQQLTAQQLSQKQLKAEEKRLQLLSERKLKAQKYNDKYLNNNKINSLVIDGNNETNEENENSFEQQSNGL